VRGSDFEAVINEHGFVSGRYQFEVRDAELLWSASVLLSKVIASGKIRPAHMVTIAKLQHILSVLPRVTEDVTASVSVCCPPHHFEEIETYHWWEFGVEDGLLRVTSGGHFYRPSSGGDTFTTMLWEAAPDQPTVLDDFSDGLRIVPDLRSYSEGVETIDFAVEDYSLVIVDPDNSLLEAEEDTEDEDTDAGDEYAEADEPPEDEVEDGAAEDDVAPSEPWSITPVDAAEERLATVVEPDQVTSTGASAYMDCSS
jgi:hypothetical protein